MKRKTYLITIICIFIYFSGYGLEMLSTPPGSEPVIAGKAALTIDPSVNEIIYTKNIDRKMYPASVTKLITALLLAERKSEEDILFYSKEAKAVYPYKIDLPPGTEMKAHYAMDALLLFSGNDIAYMIGENISGSISHFSLLMNEYVNELGLKNTHFVNPHGLHDDNHYSTAYDISIIVRRLYRFPWIMETIRKKESRIFVNNTFIDIINRNKLVGQAGCLGGKTGWTPQAGRCLAALFERHGRKMVGIVLGSIYDTKDTTVFADMEKIIDYSYQAKKKTIIKAPLIVRKIPLSFRLIPFFGPRVSRLLPVQILDDVKAYPKGEPLDIFFSFSDIHLFHLNPDTAVGKLTVKFREQSKLYNLYPTISTSDILRWDILPFYTALVACILIIFFFSMVVRLLIKKKKHDRR